MSFMRWQLRRGVLEPAHGERPGSPWWRAVNERLLRDGCEAVALSGGRAGPASSRTVGYWLSFADHPTARTWYRAHNASVVAAYLEHRDLAEAENAAERFFMNVVLCRVLYTHALVAAPRMSLGWLRPLAPFLGDPRLGMTGIFLQLSRVLPDEYPLTDSVDSYLSNELGFGRLLDFGVILPRLQQIYEWSANELGEPGLRDCVRDGAPTYAWPFEERASGKQGSLSPSRRHSASSRPNSRSTFGKELRDRTDHAIGVITEDPIDAHVDHLVELTLELRVPRQCVTLETVKQRRETTVPVAHMHIDRIDTGLGELRRPPLGTVFHRPQACRVDELDIRIERPPRRGELPVVVTDPQSSGRAIALRGFDDCFDGRGVLDVECELKVGTAREVELVERRDVTG